MSIKIVHTSDWHLGKKLFKTDRIMEQKLFLDWMVDLVISEKIDAMVIAGDVFDVPNPPTEALRIYFDFLKKITAKSMCHLFIISGNHDSGRFLEAPSPFLKENRIHIVGNLSHKLEDYIFPLENENKEKIYFTLLPYFRSFEIINLGKELGVTEDQTETSEFILGTLGKLFEKLCSDETRKDHPQLLVAHHLFGQFAAAGSEQALSLSGLDSIPTSFLNSFFDYVALGHIHKAQTIKQVDPHVYYSGSPFPLRFSENKNKKLAIVEFEQDKSFEKRLIDIPNFRKIISMSVHVDRLEDKLTDIIDQHKDEPKELPALLEARITLNEPRTGLADAIREKISDFPIKLLSVHTEFADNAEDTDEVTSKQPEIIPDTLELFEIFYKKKFPDAQTIPDKIKEEFIELLNNQVSEDL